MRYRKWKYFLWSDPNMGWGVGPAIYYVLANTKEGAKKKLMKQKGLKYDPDFISGDVIEVNSITQPKPIEVIK